LVNIGQLKSVERLKLETLQMELNFNMTGAVNDESAQAIGRMLGAQYILSGSLEQLGDKYRIRFRAISVETAVIQYSYSENIQNDDIVQYLMADGSYTKKERMEHAALNLAFGTGSFLWDDKFGGGITAVAEGVGVAGMAFGLIYGSGESLLREEMKAYPFFIGAGLYVGGAIFGAIRALTYNQTGANISYKHIDGFNIGFVSTNNSNIEVQISYKMYY
jgi:hypothetical protein